MKTNASARVRAKMLTPVVLLASLAAVVGLASCSKSDSNSTDVASTEAKTSEAAATEAPKTEATASEAKVTETTAAAPATEAAAPVTEAAAPLTEAVAAGTDAVAAGSDAATAGGAALKLTLIGELMKSMNNGAPADQKDIDCVSGKVTEGDVSALMASAAGGGGMTKDAVPVLKAMFSCKPKGLTDSFIESSFTDIPADVTVDQKSCMANKFFDFIASNDEIMTSIVADASKPPAAFKTEGAKIVKECVPAGKSQDVLIAEMNKA
jgi:hypothetical protein